MKKILVLTAVLSVIAVATVGCLYIFEVLNYEDSMSNLVKVVGALVLLGGCSALIAGLMGSGKKPPA
jgi:hypothetical protein